VNRHINEPPKSGWNWWAFFVPPLWCLLKGMWLRGIAFALLYGGIDSAVNRAVEEGGLAVALGALAISIGARAWWALKANEVYYIRWRKRQIALGNLPSSEAPGESS